jgi:flavin-dependent dehydrogenase
MVQSYFGDGPFRVKTSIGEFEAQSLINASGRWSNLTAIALNERPREKWVGIKGHFAEDFPPASVDLYFFEGGYCGVQPVNSADDQKHGRINACAMVRADVASSLPEVFALHPALRDRSTAWQPLIDPVTTSPLIFRTPASARDCVLQAGDAAAFVDPFIGDGISLALRSGALAARTLLPFLRKEITLEQAAANYQQAYKRDLVRVFRASSKLRRMLAVPHKIRKPFVFMLEKSPRITRYLVKKTR